MVQSSGADAGLRQYSSAVEVAPNQPIAWQQGPSQTATTDAERLPNIIFILADDLGMNDLSTFGGGVAGGAVPTPAINRLAEGGVSFSQIYKGNATCPPSCAMLLIGRAHPVADHPRRV